MERPINLDVKDAGSWRRVASFDLDALTGDLQTAVDQLLSMSTQKKLAARLITPGDSAPLATWNKADGWNAWGHAA